MINIAGNFGVVQKGVLKTGGNEVAVAVKAIKSELFAYVLALNIISIPYIHVCCIHAMNSAEWSYKQKCISFRIMWKDFIFKCKHAVTGRCPGPIFCHKLFSL